jgi:acyl phosphate:glycerol-3-phosphate acyltransferase
MKLAIVLIAAYLIGSIPFSYLVTRIRTGKDIRLMGSRNVGATNVLRTTGKLPGILALLLDVFKGAGAVLMARYFFPMSPGMAAAAGFAAMVGHSYPIFLGFKGGKSVATGGGAFLILAPLAILSSIAIFVIMLFGFRIVSLASMIGSASFPLFAWFYGSTKEVAMLGGLSAGWIIFRHHENLIRLFQGTERKVRHSKND